MSTLTHLNTKALSNGDPAPGAPASGQVRVYNMRFCPWAERAVLYLALKQIPAEVINIHLQEKPDWYFEKHPEGKVPAVEVDGEVTIESGLIPEYLDDKYPEHRILPTDAFAKFEQKLLAEKLSSLSSTFYGLVAAFKDPSLAEDKYAAVKTAFEKAENLLQNKFYGGDKPGFADVLAFPFFERHSWVATLGKGPLDGTAFPGKEYPKLTEYFAAMQAVPEIKANIMSIDAYKAFFASFISGTTDFDAGL